MSVVVAVVALVVTVAAAAAAVTVAVVVVVLVVVVVVVSERPMGQVDSTLRAALTGTKHDKNKRRKKETNEQTNQLTNEQTKIESYKPANVLIGVNSTLRASLSQSAYSSYNQYPRNVAWNLHVSAESSCCLSLNVPATRQCISGTDLLRQFLRDATLRQKLQIKLSTSPSHSMLTPGPPVPGLTL